MKQPQTHIAPRAWRRILAEQARVAWMTHDGVRTGHDQPMVLVNALHEGEVGSEPLEAPETGDASPVDEQCPMTKGTAIRAPSAECI